MPNIQNALALLEAVKKQKDFNYNSCSHCAFDSLNELTSETARKFLGITYYQERVLFNVHSNLKPHYSEGDTGKQEFYNRWLAIFGELPEAFAIIQEGFAP